MSVYPDFARESGVTAGKEKMMANSPHGSRYLPLTLSLSIFYSFHGIRKSIPILIKISISLIPFSLSLSLFCLSLSFPLSLSLSLYLSISLFLSLSCPHSLFRVRLSCTTWICSIPIPLYPSFFFFLFPCHLS
jgi:hypothetical protein